MNSTTPHIPSTEGPYIEFKGESTKAMDLAEEIVAFSNTEGGEIWFGVEDDGTISGLSRCYEEDVMNICRTSCIPPVSAEYQTISTENRFIARILVPKGKDKPYCTSRNKYYTRIGTTKRIASREELLRLFQASGALHYDIVEIDKGKLNDLDIGQIADYFTRYGLSFIDEPESERVRLMRNTDIIGDNTRPTLAGLLVFGIIPERIVPCAEIAFAHFNGSTLTADLIDKKTIGGPLPRQVENSVAALKSNLMVGSTIKSAKREDARHYPDRVFRELVVNACIHRNYSITGSVIRIFVFSDRVEFISPGPLPNTVSIEKLSVGTSFARNPTLARFMENLGYVDKLGRGLPMVYQEAKKLGLTVIFEEIGHEFKVTLPLPVIKKKDP